MKFTPGWLLTIFVAFFFPLFVYLGFWQLDRAHEKAVLESHILAGQQSIKALPARGEPIAYQRYQLSGRLDAEFGWLLDNRTHQGQVGYELWVPLITDQDWYLASLGWFAAGPSRQLLPRLFIPDQSQDWLAQGRPLSRQFVLADTPLIDQWPQVIQALEPDAMAKKMGMDAPSGLVQLEAGQPGVGYVIWQPSVVPQARHRGYAFQWFAMALALASMYLYAGLRLPSTHAAQKRSEDQEE